jgi:hypothetical protein
MKSTLVEFARFENLEEGFLRAGDRYLQMVANLRVRTRHAPIGQRDFYTLMRKLRYGTASEQERQEALTKLPELITKFFLGLESEEENQKPSLLSILDEGRADLQQLDLVANAAELSALPFEAALAKDGTPLFLSGGGVVLTRRVRGRFTEQRPSWPTRPRVLFAWSAAGGKVPQDEHRKALLAALEPWLPPSNRESVFVEVGNARLSDLEAAIQDATEAGKGFSHVHLLAHGHPVREVNDDRFGVAFTHPVEGMDVVAPEQLSKALTGIRSSAVVVTLAACDAGNQTDTITPEKSVAHELHVSGLPVVVASQLPLTVSGSNILVRRFYHDLLEGRDVRSALHRARVELYEKREEAGHDWLSLVGYVELREGYADFLQEIRLKSQLASLENLRDRAAVAAKEGAASDVLMEIGTALKLRIDRLENLLSETRCGAALDENRGLLGSAEKRLAELCFHHFKDEAGQRESQEALKRARDCYRLAFEANPSHHWSGVQYLALHAALTGEVNPAHWKTAYRAAEVDRQRPNEFWAQGSLAELALLDLILGKGTDLSATEYLVEMKDRVAALKEAPSHNPFGSTALQLLRYVNWWRQDLGFFPGTPDLASAAGHLAKLIKPMD